MERIVLEGNIDGTFYGWTGETLFLLTNGQIWQQTSYSYSYHYAYRPRVQIFNSGGGDSMRLTGYDNSIRVKRLK
jgi:hypothetical protein